MSDSALPPENRSSIVNQSPQLLPATGGKAGPLSRFRDSLERKAHAFEESSEIETSFDAPKRVGLIVAFLVFGVFGVWSALAPLEGYAHAPGIVTVRSYKKVIQNLEGGIVKQLNVQNGDVVKEGDVLLVLDSTQALAQLEIQKGQMLALRALEARMVAERDNLDAIDWPADLTLEGQGANERRSQQQVFNTRKASQQGSIDVLNQRIEQLGSRVDGLRALQESKRLLSESFAAELADVRQLLDRGFENKGRLREVERAYAQASGEAAEIEATIAATEIQIGETRLEILQLENEFQREVADQLAETQVNLQNTRERVAALSDIVARTDVRAPASGVVNQLQIHTVGGVLNPGGVIAEIVPENDELIIEGRVATTDIDRVAQGQEAMVRLSALNAKSVPTLYGTVIGLSADAATDEVTRLPYYSARIALKPESLAALEGMELIPGMPAEAFISTGSRTFLQYLMKPLSNSMARSFNED
jgi:membrane fusion protein, epimerase transport system